MMKEFIYKSKSGKTLIGHRFIEEGYYEKEDLELVAVYEGESILDCDDRAFLDGYCELDYVFSETELI